MSSLTRQLTRLIAGKPVSDNDLKVAQLFLMDAAANIIAGQNSVPGQKLLKWAHSIAPDNNLNLLDPARKAFLLGALCHILEVDDLHRASVVHPGCIAAPVIFALAAGQSGRAALTAFLKGIEATTRIGMAVGPEHYKVWHNTATCGPYGSAIAAAYLLDLDENQSVHALGNAGSQSAGFWQFLDSGAETKHLHAGRGAEAGLVAAQLASQGFTGAPDILEGSRGFFEATCTNPPIENLLAEPDAPWQVHQTSIKPWPSCRHTHPAIEVALDLHRKISGSSFEIDKIDVETYQAALNLCDRPQPDSVYGAKFSLQHCIAIALRTGVVDLASFDEKARSVSAPLSEKFSIRAAPKFETTYPNNWGTAITLKFGDGSTLNGQTTNAKGDPEAPLSEGELVEKASGLLAFSGINEAQKLLEQLQRLNDDDEVPDLVSLLTESRT